jgi:SAM-dependent methyltransferase
VFLILFLGSLLTYAPAFWTRVPYYPTHRAAYALILAELPNDRPFTFIDIGCGTGDLLLFLSARRPKGRFVGVEIGLIPWFIAKLRSLRTRSSSVTIHFQTMWGLDLGRYDFVYTFLSPAPMERLWSKAKAEMKTGSTFITNTFETPEQASYTIAVKNERQTALYVHRI